MKKRSARAIVVARAGLDMRVIGMKPGQTYRVTKVTKPKTDKGGWMSVATATLVLER